MNYYNSGMVNGDLFIYEIVVIIPANEFNIEFMKF